MDKVIPGQHVVVDPEEFGAQVFGVVEWSVGKDSAVVQHRTESGEVVSAVIPLKRLHPKEYNTILATYVKREPTVTNRERFKIPEGFGRAIVEYDSTGSPEVIAYVKYPADARLVIEKLRDSLSTFHFESKIADAKAE